MKLSAQEEYGLRCLLRVAKEYPEGSVTIPTISKAEELSEPHVAKLLMILRKGGYINSTRGHSGGYALAQPPEEIVIGEVLAQLGGKLYDKGFCGRHSGSIGTCVHEGECAIMCLWADIQTAIDSVVSKITLKEILDKVQAEQNQLIQIQTSIPKDRIAANR
ncbi:MAG: Rrf2 family transcriptional regulator [Fimbriimonadaceae bacterium]|nr:Rrf2 family transcriptional regulator [Fimbriimonadaceae bacterium]